MQPFRELVKTSSQFYWDKNLQDIFQNSKSVLINQATEQTQSSDINQTTCLQTDWIKEEIGYLLPQKYCQNPNTKALTCCHDGWKLVFARSWFTYGTEKNYSPTEGESPYPGAWGKHK